MYSEKTFKNYIFWIQVKRFVIMFIMTVVGVLLGLLTGKILEGTANIKGYTTILIIIFALVFFVLSLLFTSGTGKEVQDGYWKIAVLRKLTAIQKTLDLDLDAGEETKIPETNVAKPKENLETSDELRDTVSK